MRPALAGAHGKSRLAGPELVGIPMEYEKLRKGLGVGVGRGSAQSQELKGRILGEWSRGGVTSRKGSCPLVPHLSVA